MFTKYKNRRFLMRKQMLVVVVAGSWLALAAGGRAADEKVPLDKVPAKISAAINGRFPGAELKSVEKESEDGKVMFDVELTQKGRKYEMDIKEDGTIVEIEKGVAEKDFPAACAAVLKKNYPTATVKDIMEVNKVEGTKETPIHYEVTIEQDKKEQEIIVSLDGKSAGPEKQ
jgi:putative PepSY-like beta-lactamase-inhibitor